ncbi:nuclear transport factor 2 family protein [Gordonia desulfuricans]|uniref:Nuclear transport factor 2 family protein n=1 Tax=Gordonia desulfuricans TaxID=89051 RepID=A0A7K3LU77_9ACTN|nr:nuclear transport factor 2 family protein [Gordonia desulfuricans]NDK91845.1 nuclear transport factor 2 family protein [Gordonia desulfuricans]
MTDDLVARLAALENRLQSLEDERAIRDLIASYGPLVDDGDAAAVADLWTPDGVYDVDGWFMDGQGAIADMVNSRAHQGIVATGCAHVLGPVHIRLDGDTAVAVGYSLLVVRDDKRFLVARATAHRWELARTDTGWRAQRRTSRALDGNPEAHALAAEVIRESRW